MTRTKTSKITTTNISIKLIVKQRNFQGLTFFSFRIALSRIEFSCEVLTFSILFYVHFPQNSKEPKFKPL